MTSRVPSVQAVPEPADEFVADVEALTVRGPGLADEDVESLVVELDGFEGPLDLLLVLARSQKVDLRKISILALADQYLDFIAAAKQIRLELAADYLVMAAWLTYLKSRLLLPEPPANDDEPTGEELAARLAFQLQRLEAMRRVGARLMSRDRLGREVFVRGMPEGIRVVRKPAWEASLFDLLKGYGAQRVLRQQDQRYEVKKRLVWALEAARARLEAVLGRIPDWIRLESFLPDAAGDGENRRTYVASAFSAALELAKDGQAELRQETQFAPIYLRPKRAASEG